jgi:transcription elongation factor GreB
LNKAFTKEDDGAALEVLPDEPWPLPPGVLNYMTPRGAALLREELERLVATLASSPSPEVKRASERRVRAIERRLREGEIVTPAAGPRARVAFGASVRVRGDDDAEHTYTIVGVDEAAPSEGRVSWQSALARALLGHGVGDVVVVRAPGGEREIEIVAIDG